MTPPERLLIDAFLGQEISADELLRRFPVNLAQQPAYVVQLLTMAYQQQSADDVDYTLMISHLAPGAPAGLTAILVELLLADWHYMHENLVHWLQALRDPASVEPLYHAALRFAEVGGQETDGLPVQCTWALGDIGTESAKAKLVLLARSRNLPLREAAAYQLQRLTKQERQD
ncbi:hypothetical protein [Hymenobacter antarcticus]|uniref:HEAT repeat-containing protein n=1 Tax=Hymenobacter antarcticus TaxID=486270 RepID=A0ABP7P7Y4_9BACT